MAGTRLLIQVVFVVEFLVVLGVALYLGILSNPTDRLSIALFQQNGRGLLSHVVKASPIFNGDAQSLPMEHLSPVTLLCQESQVIFWKDIMQKVKLPADHVVVQGDGSSGMVAKYCENPDLLLLAQQEPPADLIVCEFKQSRPRLVVVAAAAGTLVFYPRSMGKRQDDMESIYPSSPILDCLDSHVDVILAVDAQRSSAGDWKTWSASLQAALQTRQDAWQALIRSHPIKFNVRVVQGASVMKESVLENNQTVHHVEPASLDDIFKRPSNHRLEIIFYLPSHDATFVGNGNDDNDSMMARGVMATQGSRLVRILSSSSTLDDSTSNALAQDAVDDATDWITRQCMGIPVLTDDEAIEEESLDGSLPRWYWKLWWHQSLARQYAKAVHMAQRQANIWKTMSYRSPLTNQVVKEFREKVVHRLDAAVPALLANQSSAEALVALEESIDLLKEWESDDLYMPPLDFPPEQYAAIFAPLVVPLLLPLLVGLVREYLRYRQLEQKKVTKKKEDENAKETKVDS